MVMPIHKSRQATDLSPFNAPHKFQEAPALWEAPIFSFDMDNRPPKSSSDEQDPRNSQRSRSSSTSPTIQTHHGSASGSSIPDDALLAQLAASHTPGTGLDTSYPMPGTHPIMNPTLGFYGNLYHDNMPSQLPPLSSMDFAWNQFQHNQQPGTSLYGSQFASTSNMTNVGYNGAQFSLQSEAGPSSSRRSTSSIPDDLPEAERLAMAEEKRKRNTAASARFRIKKKQRATNLERSVSDLTGRAEELEKEAADLRRENGWLKEIVMLKGTRFAAANALQHQSPTSRGAIGDQPVASTNRLISGAGSQASTSEAGSDDDYSEDNDDDSRKDKKGKGKKKTKKKN